ncbi:MAG: transporter substrate-binding domain-containing protein [Erysipelothrix sp.]|jgi:polar amino acid transport system substrate-binding protein|nr:transporter substrate-binding domain-containing protein [Erysipelothrix sp.]
MKKVSILLVLLLLFVGCTQKPPQTKEVLKVGMELAYPPFETTDAAGNPDGVSVEIAKEFAEYLGWDIEIINTNWTGLIPALQTKQIDMVISSMTITEERKESVDFSDPYARALLALIIPIDLELQDSDELNDPQYTIAVKTGTTGDNFATQHFEKATILRFDNESNAVAEVVNKRAQAFIYGQLTILRNVKSNDQATKPFFLSGEQNEAWGAAFTKGSDLTAQFNAFLKQYREDGGFDRVTEKYLAEEKALFDEYNFTFFFDFD